MASTASKPTKPATSSATLAPSIRLVVLAAAVALVSISVQIDQVNTLPAFLYNFASSLTNSNSSQSDQKPTPTPKPPQQSHEQVNQHSQQQKADLGHSLAIGGAGGQPQHLDKQDQQQVSAPLNNVADQQMMNIQKAANGLQQQLSAFQSQAQKQLAGQQQKFHMLEVLSNMGKAIQQQLMSNANGNNIQIITSPALGNANNKKNEYQQTGSAPEATRVADPSAVSGMPSPPVLSMPGIGSNYREQGEQIRQDIVRRAGQLQQVLSSSMDAIKDKGDVIVKRLLEQLSSRLDQAKSKADKIINEPATNEVAIKTLNAINQGLHNLNNIITNIVSRFDLTASKDATASQKVAAGLAILNGPNGAERLKQQLASATPKP